MASEPDATTWPPTKGLDERVLSALEGLPGRIAFSGLRRTLRVHPESLSRSLRRLEREGRVERSADGYRAVPEVRPDGPKGFHGLRPIARVELPPGAMVDGVFARLAGRWFGSLRWVGVVDGPTGQLLTWAGRDGTGQVLLGIHRGVLNVFVRDDRSGEDDETEDSAYELLAHAAEALRLSPGSGRGPTSFLAADAFSAEPRVDN